MALTFDTSSDHKCSISEVSSDDSASGCESQIRKADEGLESESGVDPGDELATPPKSPQQTIPIPKRKKSRVPEMPRFQCNLCFKIYARAGVLRRHIERGRCLDKKQSDPCLICGLTFSKNQGPIL